MRHDWDNYTHDDFDVCKKCQLKRRSKAKVFNIDSLVLAGFYQYLVNGEWQDGNKLGKEIHKCTPNKKTATNEK